MPLPQTVCLPFQAAKEATHPKENLAHVGPRKDRRPPSVSELCSCAARGGKQVGRCPWTPLEKSLKEEGVLNEPVLLLLPVQAYPSKTDWI